MVPGCASRGHARGTVAVTVRREITPAGRPVLERPFATRPDERRHAAQSIEPSGSVPMRRAFRSKKAVTPLTSKPDVNTFINSYLQNFEDMKIYQYR